MIYKDEPRETSRAMAPFEFLTSVGVYYLYISRAILRGSVAYPAISKGTKILELQ